ncbi:uncharacterized protein NPIL_528031 [Nephila pilipes]|uniref:Uncharacterized protein n=1 Tax=Nephila pilipes TaxID=299642 RepID=A0A8X6QZT6_NEPPI|nr:uncharacterized protein NPIL_528031 [Nephila pilipes]
MHRNSRLFSERGSVNVRPRNPFIFTRANRRIKPRKNRAVEAIAEDVFAETFSENDRNSSKRFRDMYERKYEELFPKRSVALNFLRGLILILCISCFLYQSTKFCLLYLTYPTTLSLAVISPEVVIEPAFTLCSSDLVNRTYFCNEYPNLCMKPRNLTQFYEKYPFNCQGDISNLMIPKYDGNDHFKKEELEALRHMLLFASYSPSKGSPVSFSIGSSRKVMRRNLIYQRQYGLHYICYSSNLHLDDNAEPDKWNFSLPETETQNFISHLSVILSAHESFFYRMHPVVFFAVHSPFIQVNPFIEQNILKLGHDYEIIFRLEAEEHLLSHPFPTDCRDYVDMWRKNNKTGPRSQEACKKKCSDSYETQCWEHASSHNVLRDNGTQMKDYTFCGKMILDEILSCEMNCKANCLINAFISIYIAKTEVNVLRHNRLYGTEELFSYFGGLMGCWLGISVWASVGIFESAYRKIIQMKRQLREE